MVDGNKKRLVVSLMQKTSRGARLNLPLDPDRGTVLMIDVRNVYRKVTRKIDDFSPEQEQNQLAIVWLYRGETGRYLGLVSGYCTPHSR